MSAARLLTRLAVAAAIVAAVTLGSLRGDSRSAHAEAPAAVEESEAYDDLGLDALSSAIAGAYVSSTSSAAPMDWSHGLLYSH